MEGPTTMRGGALPRIAKIRVAREMRLAVEWAEGPRAGKSDEVDLSPAINSSTATPTSANRRKNRANSWTAREGAVQPGYNPFLPNHKGPDNEPAYSSLRVRNAVALSL